MANNEVMFNIIVLFVVYGMLTRLPLMTLAKSTKFKLESFESTFDSVFVTNFRRVSPDSDVYECVMVKDISSFFIDVIIHQMNKDREVYKLNNLEGCVFLSNTPLNRLFNGLYETLLVNRSKPITCPIKAGSYLFRNAFNKNVLPPIHPKGNFSMTLRLKSDAYYNVMLQLKWLYRLT